MTPPPDGGRRTVVMVVDAPPGDAAGRAVVRLADQVVARGHRVAVFAHGEGARLAAEGSPLADQVTSLLQRGVHGGLASWVVDGASLPPGLRPAAGVVLGDGSDLWRLVHEADVVLGAG